MALQDQIKKVYVRVGRAYTIVRGAVEITGEYLEPQTNSQATKPFVLLNFLRANLAFDTQILPGDTIRFNDDNSYYLVTTKLPEVFRGSAISFSSVLYRCNDVATLSRLQNTRDADLKVINTWQQVGTQTWRVLIADSFTGEELAENESFELKGKFKNDNQDMYICGSCGIKLGDRVTLATIGEHYMAASIKKTRYDNVYQVMLDDDTR